MMIGMGAMSAVVLGLVNVSLEKYIQRNPNSCLNCDMDDGCNRRLSHYIVPMMSMGLGVTFVLVDICCPFGLSDLKKLDSSPWQDWWFGVQQRWAATWAMSIGAGHYAQEIFANRWCGVVLFVHHLAAIAHAFFLEAASSWSGLLLSWSGVYEAGSFILCLGYVGAVSRRAGHWWAIASTSVGLCFGVHGLFVQWCHAQLSELNAAAWCSIITLLGLGVGRIQDGVQNLRMESMARLEAHKAAQD
mmetsp:Transcript_120223/g.256568  ORF Transcript_120223/g.256568 Transcript_120223/m.256568 type:complete len:245 (-) Transcript_120223:161-895(-)